MSEDKWHLTDTHAFIVEAPKRSAWVCYAFGKPYATECAFVYRPLAGREPGMLARWAMRVFFDCHWRKEPE